jgi:hypothetical protein
MNLVTITNYDVVTNTPFRIGTLGSVISYFGESQTFFGWSGTESSSIEAVYWPIVPALDDR